AGLIRIQLIQQVLARAIHQHPSGLREIVHVKRHQIFERDGYRCVYCGEQFAPEELTLDHVEPRVRGGDRSEGSLVTACMRCTTLKGHRRLSHFLHAEATARRTFFLRAVHVWPRLRQIVERELAELDATDAPIKKP